MQIIARTDVILPTIYMELGYALDHSDHVLLDYYFFIVIAPP